MRMKSHWVPRLSDKDGTLAERLCTALAEDILAGQLPVGSRLPAHRTLAQQLETSVVTVGRAYAALERRGLVRGEHGRGTFVAALREPDQNAQEVDLSLNLPPPILPEDTYAKGIADLARMGGLPDPSRYPPCAGRAEHRAATAAWLSRHRFSVTPDELLLTNGGQQAIAVAFTCILRNGGAILAEEATYPGALVTAESLARPIVGIPMDQEGMIPSALDQAAREVDARLIYVVPTLQNPTGSTMGPQRRADITEIARRHDLQIVEDDIYSVLLDNPPPALRAWAPDRTWYLNSFSKAVSAVLRLGFLIPPAHATAREDAESAIQATSWTANPFSATLLFQWLTDGTADQAVTALRQETAARIDLARTILGNRIPVNQQALHIWIPMDETEAERVVRRAADAGVRLTPPTAPLVTPGQGCGIRICLGAPPTRSDLERGLTILRGVLGRPSEAVI